jgi:hypothetical protein
MSAVGGVIQALAQAAETAVALIALIAFAMFVCAVLIGSFAWSLAKFARLPLAPEETVWGDAPALHPESKHLHHGGGK